MGQARPRTSNNRYCSVVKEWAITSFVAAWYLFHINLTFSGVSFSSKLIFTIWSRDLGPGMTSLLKAIFLVCCCCCCCWCWCVGWHVVVVGWEDDERKFLLIFLVKIGWWAVLVEKWEVVVVVMVVMGRQHCDDGWEGVERRDNRWRLLWRMRRCIFVLFCWWFLFFVLLSWSFVLFGFCVRRSFGKLFRSRFFVYSDCIRIQPEYREEWDRHRANCKSVDPLL